jgi:uncharacterized integral membrane protein
MPVINTGVPDPRPARARTNSAWIFSGVFAALLFLLATFILQNLHRTSVDFFGVQGSWPVGAALLLSALFGMLLVAVPTARGYLRLRGALQRLTPPAYTTEPPSPLAETAAQPVEV